MALPAKSRMGFPLAKDGNIYEAVGKYARGAVLYAFEQMGGPDRLTEWAEDNPGEFYTKLFPRIITRETEVHHVRSVDELMDVLDAGVVEDAVMADPAPGPGRDPSGPGPSGPWTDPLHDEDDDEDA